MISSAFIGKHNDETLTRAYKMLNHDQKDVLDNNVRRGKRTKWLNVMAKQKGLVLTEAEVEDPKKAYESLIEWILIDIVDGMKIDPNLRCECGRALRYRYEVLHTKTNKTHYFGKNHLQQHTGLDPETVRLVYKGLKDIDLEKEEILSKIICQWIMPFEIPKGIEIPSDMVEQLSVGLPLLRRQEVRLKKHIDEYLEKQSVEKFTKYKELKPNRIQAKQISFMGNTKQQDDIAEKHVETHNVQKSSIAIEYRPREIEILLNRFFNFSIGVEELKQLYYALKSHQVDFNKHKIEFCTIKNHATRSLGKTSSPSIRRWLIGIEEL